MQQLFISAISGTIASSSAARARLIDADAPHA
jgi:hypothetical protein